MSRLYRITEKPYFHDPVDANHVALDPETAQQGDLFEVQDGEVGDTEGDVAGTVVRTKSFQHIAQDALTPIARLEDDLISVSTLIAVLNATGWSEWQIKRLVNNVRFAEIELAGE